MDGSGSAQITSAFSKVFGQSKASDVIERSDLYREEAELWGDRTCFGCFYEGYSLLVLRNKSNELQASIEMEGTPSSCQKAMQSALEGIFKAVGKEDLNLHPSTGSLEMTPLGDTRPILMGEVSVQHHLLNNSNFQAGIAATATLIAVILGSTVIWDGQSAGLWAGAFPSFSVLGGLLASSAFSAKLKRIVWKMVN